MATDKFRLRGTKYVIDKDPQEVLDYTVDFSRILDPVTDTIATATVTATGGLVVDSVTHTADLVTAWLSAGSLTVDGDYASATYRITTVNAPARIIERTVYFDIKQR